MIQLKPKNIEATIDSRTTWAPGAPGITPRWTSSAKTGIGTALDPNSRVWFTLSHGVVNEVYYPRIDSACLRDMELIVTRGQDYFSEEKRATDSAVHWIADGVPAFRLENVSRDGCYRIEKQILVDPQRNALLQKIRFAARQGGPSNYRLYVLIAPHLGNRGRGNTAWIGDFEGAPMLFAQREDCALALACSTPWLERSAGYVGTSDGWQDLNAHKQLTWHYSRAEHGNVALIAELDVHRTNGNFVIALGLGADPSAAALAATHSLRDGFDVAKSKYIEGWQAWRKTCSASRSGDLPPAGLSQISLAVLRAHESKTAPGGIIASLSIPWGFNKGDDDLGGYHLVWSRDLVEAGGGFLAAGAHEDARRVLSYLETTQLPDGHWPQNMWLDGTAYWNGIQMDETALPILLVDLARRENAIGQSDIKRLWPLVRGAAAYLACNGPVSPQDRWEEDPGYSPFTVGAQVAALLAAADIADLNQEIEIASYLRETADVWNLSIERWMYVSQQDWCRKYDVDGYYVRIGSGNPQRESSDQDAVFVKNVTADKSTQIAAHLVSTGALALVRFGVRAAADPRITDTVKVIDALLKITTPYGDTWHRYNDDGYGEHMNGAPFDGTGIGRGWPLLTGERAHYELAAGRTDLATKLRGAMESFANPSGFIPEQVWDSPDIEDRSLRCGRPSGSAMPLVWAHAEYLKLQRSLVDGRVFDLPPQTVQRYQIDKVESPRMAWRFNNMLRSIDSGKMLRVEVHARAVVHWSHDEWKNARDIDTRTVGLGLNFVDLLTESLAPGSVIRFTFFWPDANRWEGKDFAVCVGNATPSPASA